YGTGADKRHVSPDDVDELWQLVDAGLAHEKPELRHPGVVLELARSLPLRSGGFVLREQVFEMAFGVNPHGSELETVEGPSALTNPAVPEDGRPAVKLDKDGDDQHRNAEDCERRGRESEIECPLSSLGETGNGIRAVDEEQRLLPED